VLSTDLYQEAFSFDNLAYASTIGLVIMALAVVSVLAQRRIARAS
jgi:ABC-type sugar transport system permease subunit